MSNQEMPAGAGENDNRDDSITLVHYIEEYQNIPIDIDTVFPE